jgi:hypothetical protein
MLGKERMGVDPSQSVTALLRGGRAGAKIFRLMSEILDPTPIVAPPKARDNDRRNASAVTPDGLALRRLLCDQRGGMPASELVIGLEAGS